MGRGLASVVVASLACSPLMAGAAELKVDNKDSILKSAGAIANSLMEEYGKGDVPGLVPEPYYWWTGGVMMNTLVDYWHLTGDEKHNEAVKEGMLFQVGDGSDFMPKNQTTTLGNDDQCYWALAAMQAAENDFASPHSEQPQWLDLAKNVFEEQWQRMDASDDCGAGLRWQIFTFNVGWDVKNSVSNGCFFDLGARLARYTGNSTFSERATEAYDWLEKSGLVDAKNGTVYEGLRASDCSDIEKSQWSQTVAVINHGAASMYNQTTGDDQKKWQGRVQNFTDSIIKTFFPNDVAKEVGCEEQGNCNLDHTTYKGISIRSLAAVSQLAPFTADKIAPVLKKTGEAAAKACTDKGECKSSWGAKNGKRAESSGLADRMNALAALSNLLVSDAKGPGKGDSDSAKATESSAASASQTTTAAGQATTTTGDQGAAGKGMGVSVAVMAAGLLTSAWMGAF